MSGERRPDDDATRMRAARAVARYEIGDAYWADLILDAYWRTDVTAERLRAEKDD
jgi:hypothetical protein